MGHSVSKVGKQRVLPAAARPGGGRPTEHVKVGENKGSSSSSNDGKDPQLLANLSKMGQVKFNNNPATKTVKMASQIADRYRAQAISEQQAASPVPGHMTAASLSNLLDERKRTTSRPDLERLAASYAVDVGLLETLARYVSTPSVGTVVREVSSENGQEKVTMRATWVEPNVTE